MSAVFISNCTKKRDSLPRLNVLVGEDFAPNPGKFPVIADTGAEVTVIGDKFLRSLGIKLSMLNPPKTRLKHVAGGEITVVGSCWLSFRVNGHNCTEEVYFVTGIPDIFLSLPACKELSIVNKNFPQGIQQEACITEEQGELDLSGGHPGDALSPLHVGTCRTLSNMDEEADVRKTPMPTVDANTVPVRPEEPPFPPTEENTHKLERWLMETFESVFDVDADPLRFLSGKPQHVHMKNGSKPVACHTPIPVGVHWREDVKRLLERAVRQGVIKKVPPDEPVEWCSRMVTVRKKDGSPRICVDYQE